MKLKQYIDEVTVSTNIAKYEVPRVSKKSKLYTDIPPEKRSLDNLPRNKNKKPKCKFQDWLHLDSKGFGEHGASGGKSTNGAYYGYSHRAINSFRIGQEIKKDHIGRDIKKKCPYRIKNDNEAMMHAIRFSREVS